MELLEAKSLAQELLKQHGLISRGWIFEYDNARRRFGACHYRSRRITLSKHLVSLNSLQEVKNTILHEIAHALVGPGHHHDLVWKLKAREIGCTGDRCYNSQEVITPEARYTGVCPNGHTHKKHKRPTRQLSCGICSRKFNPELLIIWTDKFGK